jgi:FKBP-type peptidyl-prolyl cis-trans isomerase/Tfp pilus assembly protein PilF
MPKTLPVEPFRSALHAVCLGLFLGTLLIFSRAVSGDFVDCDDPDYVSRNLHVQGGLSGAGMRWAFTTDTAGNWHPLTWISHMLDWQFFGNNPHGHHATNIFWHALNAVLAFLVLRRLLADPSGNQAATSPAATGAFWTSALGAALFAWHPLRVESVAWIAERKDVLSVFFGLLTLWFYMIYAGKRRENSAREKFFYAGALLTFALGLMCKPMLVTLPFLLLLLDAWPLQRLAIGNRQSAIDDRPSTIVRLLREKIPLGVLSAVSCVLTYLAQKKGGAVVETLAFEDRLTNAAVAIAGYLGKCFWPFNLAVGYPRPAHWPAVTDCQVEWAAGAAILVGAITGAALWQWRRRPWLAVGWFWFLIALVPVIGLVPVGLQAMADRYTYLPSFGLLLAGLWSGREAIRFWEPRRLVVAAAGVLLAVCAARTWNQLAYWRNSPALYEHALKVTKDNYLAHCYLGTTLLNEDRPEAALSHFKSAVELKPDYATAQQRLALTLEKLGRDNDAVVAYEALFKFRRDDPEAQLHCANALVRLGREVEARPHYECARRLQPDLTEARFNDADSFRGSPPPKAVSGFTDRELIESWGWIVAQQENLAGIEISPSERTSFLQGFSSSIHGRSSPCDLWQASPDLERLGKARREKLFRAIERRNESEADAFFAGLKSNTNAAGIADGLYAEILQAGSGALPQPRQTVSVHYTARLLDGTEFAQVGPLDLVLVTNHAPFRGWVDSIQRIGKGGAIRVYVPPPLPQTEAFKWGIAPGSARIFDVELLDVRDSSKQELADALVLPAPEPELPASGYSEAQLFETWGWTIGQKTRADQFGFTEEQLLALTQAIRSGLDGNRSPANSPAMIPAVENFVNEHREQARQVEKRKRMAEAESLFAELKKNRNVVELPDGLRYEILKPGGSVHPKPDQFVKVNYVGQLISGKIFDRTDPTLGPLDIKVGTVIPGWNEGIQKIGKGGKIKLYIPPELGYGEVATGGIPPEAPLIFEIELLDIRETLDDSTPAR